jgi:hypothetical protein
MADKLLICISTPQATVARWRGGKISESGIFASDDAGLEEFGVFLDGFNNVPAYLLIDAVEEDYRIETLPHTYGSDRAELVNRKLKQYYRNKPYVAACLQGRDQDKRRDDRYLFSALTNPDLLTPWMEAIAEHELPVAGIYLLPMVSTELSAKLQDKSADILMVSQQSTGLRLTFLHDGQFRLSRLTRADNARDGGSKSIIADEISNTRHYLDALRVNTLDEQLTVLLLDRNDEFTEAAENLARDNPGLSCIRLGPHELSELLVIPEELLRASPDVISLQLLGLRTPEGNLAPASVTVGFRRYQMRRRIHISTAITVLGAVLWSALNFSQIIETRSDAENAARQTMLQQGYYKEVTRQFPAAPTSAENLQRAVEIAHNLRKTARTPEKMMAVVSAAMLENPSIALREFTWNNDRNTLEDGGNPARTAETPAPGVIVPRTQSGLIAGEIRPFRGDYRAAVNTINAFAARLARDPAVARAQVVKLPLNVNPSSQISGNTLDSREEAGSADFRLLLVMKPNT